MNRRSAVLTLASFGVASSKASGADAAARYPSRPIKVVMPFGAGGSADAITRLIADAMQSTLGQSVVVENRPGAGGNIGTEAVAHTAPDGYTLLLGGTPNLAINPSLYARTGFDSEKDFDTIAMMVSAPNLIVVNPEVPVHTLQELIAHAKATAGGVAYTTAAAGGTGHLTGEMLAALSGATFLHVPDKNPLLAVLGGHTPASIYTVAATLPQVRSGKLRAVAVTGSRRMTIAPEIPTVAESGFPGFEAVAWYGLVGPKGLPAEVRKTLYESIAAALHQPEVMARLAALGCEVDLMDGPAFARFLGAEKRKWADAVKRSGARAD